MRTFWAATIALFVAINVPGVARSAETGTIKGLVVDSSGKGLRGAIVSAIDEDHQKSISVLTDPQGRFILDQLPPKPYTIRARLVGFEDASSDELEIASGGANKDVRLAMALAEQAGTLATGPLSAEVGRLWAASAATVGDDEDFNRIVQFIEPGRA